jgi:hypothetical protein
LGQGLVEVDFAAAFATAVEVYDTVAGDTKDPGSKGYTLESIVAEGFQDLEHDVGGEVFGLLLVA